MRTKAWKCPRCGRDFIVAGDAERDVCPWCKTTIQEKAGALEEQAPQSPSPSGSSQGKPTTGHQAGGEMWWPYEYDPFMGS